MDYVNLGRTGLRVSRVCLGMMSYGKHESREWTLDEDGAEPILRHAVAERRSTSSTPPTSTTAARARCSPGSCCASCSGCGRSTSSPRRSTAGRCPARTVRACPASTSWPRSTRRSRASDSTTSTCTRSIASIRSTPIEETMEALHDVVKAGKARYIGASSMFAWQFAKAQAVGRRTRFVSMQNHYNLDLPRGGAGDDPAVHRPGRRGDPVEPAGARDAGRQPHSGRGSAHQAGADRRVRRDAVQAGDRLRRGRARPTRWQRPRGADRAGGAGVAAAQAGRDGADRRGDQARAPRGRARRRAAVAERRGDRAAARSATSRTRSPGTSRPSAGAGHQ